eukprot:1197725-Amphidinium_carterae.2
MFFLFKTQQQDSQRPPQANAAVMPKLTKVCTLWAMTDNVKRKCESTMTTILESQQATSHLSEWHQDVNRPNTLGQTSTIL